MRDERPSCSYCEQGFEPNSNGYHFWNNPALFVPCVEMCQGGAHEWVKKGYVTETEIGPEGTGWLECERCGESKPLEE